MHFIHRAITPLSTTTISTTQVPQPSKKIEKTVYKETRRTLDASDPSFIVTHLTDLKGKCSYNLDIIDFVMCVAPVTCRSFAFFVLMIILLFFYHVRRCSIGRYVACNWSLRTAVLFCAISIILAMICELAVHKSIIDRYPSITIHPSENGEIVNYMNRLRDKGQKVTSMLAYPYHGNASTVGAAARETHRYVEKLIKSTHELNKMYLHPRETFYINSPLLDVIYKYEWIHFLVFMATWSITLLIFSGLAAAKHFEMATLFGIFTCCMMWSVLVTESMFMVDCCTRPRKIVDRVVNYFEVISEEQHFRNEYLRICKAWFANFELHLEYYEKQYLYVAYELTQRARFSYKKDEYYYYMDMARRIQKITKQEVTQLRHLLPPRCTYNFDDPGQYQIYTTITKPTTTTPTTTTDENSTTIEPTTTYQTRPPTTPRPYYEHSVLGPSKMPPSDSAIRTICSHERELKLVVSQIILMMIGVSSMILIVLMGFVCMRQEMSSPQFGSGSIPCYMMSQSCRTKTFKSKKINSASEIQKSINLFGFSSVSGYGNRELYQLPKSISREILKRTSLEPNDSFKKSAKIKHCTRPRCSVIPDIWQMQLKKSSNRFRALRKWHSLRRLVKKYQKKRMLRLVTKSKGNRRSRSIKMKKFCTSNCSLETFFLWRRLKQVNQSNWNTKSFCTLKSRQKTKIPLCESSMESSYKNSIEFLNKIDPNSNKFPPNYKNKSCFCNINKHEIDHNNSICSQFLKTPSGVKQVCSSICLNNDNKLYQRRPSVIFNIDTDVSRSISMLTCKQGTCMNDKSIGLDEPKQPKHLHLKSSSKSKENAIHHTINEIWLRNKVNPKLSDKLTLKHKSLRSIRSSNKISYSKHKQDHHIRHAHPRVTSTRVEQNDSHGSSSSLSYQSICSIITKKSFSKQKIDPEKFGESIQPKSSTSLENKNMSDTQKTNLHQLKKLCNEELQRQSRPDLNGVHSKHKTNSHGSSQPYKTRIKLESDLLTTSTSAQKYPTANMTSAARSQMPTSAGSKPPSRAHRASMTSTRNRLADKKGKKLSRKVYLKYHLVNNNKSCN